VRLGSALIFHIWMHRGCSQLHTNTEGFVWRKPLDGAVIQLDDPKGIVPTSDNPFGVLGTLFGQGSQKETKQPSLNPFKGIDKILGKIGGDKNK